MEPRISLITLGVHDVAAARNFYERLGFKASPDSNADVAFFNAGGVALAVFGRAALAQDAHYADTPAGFSGVTLAHNVRSEAEVDAVMREAVAIGATLTKPAARTFWGGYAGYFADPDGHIWEVAHNPFWTFDEAGRVIFQGSPP
jgi:uncharacterized protein